MVPFLGPEVRQNIMVEAFSGKKAFQFRAAREQRKRGKETGNGEDNLQVSSKVTY